MPKGVDGGRDEGGREEEMDVSSLLVLCDSLPLPWGMEMMTLKGSLDVIKEWLRVK